MFGKRKKTASKIASLILSAALFIPTMYGMTVKDFVRADDDFVKTLSNTRIGVDEMNNPMVLYAGVDTWRGSFVYFGKYDGQPIRFRVLDKASTKYTTDGSKTLFLDSDKVLYEEYFNNTLSSTDPNANKWSESDLKASLNGSGFLNKDGVFTQAEKDAIAESYVDGYALTGINQEAIDTFGTSVGLNGEKVFALDITDILNHDYGYYDMRDYDSVDHANYSKEAAANSGIEYTAWWLRNEGVAPTDSGIKTAGETMYYSYTTWQVNDTKAVAPALNIDHDSILFSTATSGVYGSLDVEYKLTLLDPEMIVSVTEGSVRKDWNRISFETTHSGKNITNISRSSYLITSGTIGSANNSILDYGEVHGGNGSAYFVLPSSLSGTWGQDYHVYVFAEDLNGKYESDYASAPVELANPETSGSFSGKTLSNTKFGVDDIHDPAIPANTSTAWNGSIVYFGKYEGNPIRFRVLDKASTAFGDDTTLFLDSEGALFSHQFSDNGSNQWVGSDIRAALNGNAFLDKSGVFTNQEKDAIYYSNTQSHVLTGLGQDITELISNAVGLEDDQVFLLDVEDLFNESYGYKFDIVDFDNVHSNAAKWAYFKDQMAVWALRNAEAGTNTTSAFVTRIGQLGTIGISYMSPRDIAPALNVDHDSILFSTAIKGTYGELGTAYKLTLLDPEMVVSVTEGSVRKDGNRISFETTHSGKNIRNMSRSSYLITSGIIGSASNSILDYGEVHGGNGSAYFVLPSNLSGTWGQDYHVYVFVEDLNGKYESDYAGPLVELVKPESSVPVVFEGKTASNTKIGVDDISDPRTPTSPDDAWNGSYVYFGKYSDTPVKYRVLDKDSTLFSDKTTVFLDCDSTLFDADFDSFVNANDPGSNVWINSDIRTALNGDAFLEKSGTFTAMEKSAIVASTVAGHPLTSVNADAVSEFVNYIGLENDKIFLLDAEDVLNPEYGYYDALANGPYGSSAPYHPAYNWYKCELQSPSGFNLWWLRSQDHELDSQHADYFAGVIFYGVGGTQVNEAQGVAPAMNIDSESILFSTAIKGTYGELGTAYKLTLLDPEMIVSVPEGSVSMEGNQVNFGYGLSGQNFALRSQISYIVTSKPFGSDDNSILDYGATAGGNYKGYLTLSDSVSGTWGEDYHIYIFAEKFNGTYESDYAGPLVELVKPESSVPVVFEGKTASNTKLGTDLMSSPAVPQTSADKWNGSYVYFGKYENEPVLYRVLDPKTDIFGSSTLFLDSDEGLYDDYFDEENQTNIWNDSDIRANLNGDLFLNKDGVFTSVEKASIVNSTIASHPLEGIHQGAIDLYENYVGLDGDKVFILDAEDTYNGEYGYINGYNDLGGDSNYLKYSRNDDCYLACWLRSAAGTRPLASPVVWCAGIVPQNPRMEVFCGYPVAPAFNVNQDSIIFSTAVEGDYGALGSQYKLTLKDPDIGLTVGDLEVNERSVSFTYTVSGAHKNDVTQISYLVVKKGTGYPKIDTIAAYGAVTLSGNHGGDFELPANLTGDFGTDYKVYILAEDINGTFETDYAAMAELTLPKIVFNLSDGPITCDQDQLDALAELFWNGDIDADEPIEDSTDLNRIDIDLDGTWDFELENNVLTETSTCSIKTKKEFTSVAKYASVTFIVGNAPKIARHAIRLTGSIGVKFGVDFPDGTDVSKCYVEFVTSTGRRSVVRTSSEGNTANSRYYIFNINCLELADEITATLYYDGEAIQTDTYSAMSYITYVKTHTSLFEERVVNLVDALQKYGYYMQKSDWSDNVRHYAIPKPSRTLSSIDVDRAVNKLNSAAVIGIQKNLGTSGIATGMKISLSLTSATELKLYVKPENSSVVMPSNAKAVDFNGVTYYEFSISNIGPHLLDTMRSFTITTNQGTATVSLPALFYVKSTLNNSSTTSDRKLALTAYYQYYEAAKACVG